jgi:hypothetical protein
MTDAADQLRPFEAEYRQHAGVGALLGIDPAFQAARHGRYAGCPHAVLLFGRNPLIDLPGFRG